MARMRLLDSMYARYPEHTREELLALVLCGDVIVEGERIRDPRHPVRPDAVITLARDLDEARARYVSRGGAKLEHALRVWRLPVEGRVFVDAGSSTGGFTDCLLRHGARAVHAVDVGYNQLDYRLRTDERVIVHERTNIMHTQHLDPAPQAATADLSFRSLRGAASHLLHLVGRRWAVLLIKPQFEWDAPPDGFTGTVPGAEIPEILRTTLEALEEEEIGLVGLEESPLRGRKGNREFLVLVAGADGLDELRSRSLTPRTAAELLGGL